MTSEAHARASTVQAPLLDAVFGSSSKSRPKGRAFALAVGFAVAGLSHGALYALARATEPSLETWTANMAALIHADLADSSPTAIEVAPPPLPPKAVPQALPQRPQAPDLSSERPAPAPPQPPPDPSSPETATQVSATRATDDPAAAPGQAAEVLTAEPTASPVDFSDAAFVAGSASTYAGGATTSSGTGKEPRAKAPGAGHLSNPPTKLASAPRAKSQARPVQLPPGAWKCAWPELALTQDIYEQHVVLRVQIRADGSVLAVTLLDDPGNGFGAAATACARATRFTPAHDMEGKPIPALSPPIRVRFTR